MTKEALKLALEALENISTALREDDVLGSDIELMLNTIAAIHKALAQPEQEPSCPECKAAVLYECVACSSNNYPPAAQRPWVGLTLEEVQDSYNPDYQAQTRAVEAKLKEKNT